MSERNPTEPKPAAATERRDEPAPVPMSWTQRLSAYPSREQLALEDDAIKAYEKDHRPNPDGTARSFADLDRYIHDRIDEQRGNPERLADVVAAYEKVESKAGRPNIVSVTVTSDLPQVIFRQQPTPSAGEALPLPGADGEPKSDAPKKGKTR